jgi:imidazolonepropionase-like amidohydrolase
VFEAAVAETHARGLKVAADLLPWELPQLEQAVAAGIDSLEHGIVVQELIRKQADPPAEQSRVERLLADMQKRGVALTSTLVLFERAFTTMLVTDVPTYSALPEVLQKRSADVLRWFNAREAIWFNAACRAVGMFGARGGIVLAGTDSLFVNVYPGDIHRELQLLVQCGLTPISALSVQARRRIWSSCRRIRSLTSRIRKESSL